MNKFFFIGHLPVKIKKLASSSSFTLSLIVCKFIRVKVYTNHLAISYLEYTNTVILVLGDTVRSSVHILLDASETFYLLRATEMKVNDP